MQKRLGKNYIFIVKDEFYVDLENIFDILIEQEDELEHLDEIIQKFNEKIEEDNKEKKIMQIGVSAEY